MGAKRNVSGGRSSQRKGDRGENEVLKLIRSRWPHATRNFASGGAGGSDYSRGPQGVAIETKRVERFELRKAWRQVQADAERRGEIPVLCHRWNGGPWLAIVELDELLALLELREKA